MKHVLLSFAAFGLAACGSMHTADDGYAAHADPAAFMKAYTEAWNEHDAATIAADFYDFGRTVEEQTASLEASFEQLREQGYEKSDIHEIKACETGDDKAWAGMKFTRLKTDGEPLGPALRASAYQLKWDDARGWRILSIGGYDAEAPLVCPES